MRENKKSELISKINIFVILCAAFIVLLSYFGTQNLVPDDLKKSITPSSVATMPDGSKEYFFNLEDYDYHYSGFMFYTSHQIVKAYTRGRLLYSFDKTGGIFTSTTGAAYNFISIDETMSQLAVVVTPIYKEVAGNTPEFYIGSSYAMYDEIMLSSMPRFFVSFLIVILSILLFVYYGLMREKQQLSKELLYLGYLSFFGGVWSINETDAVVLLIHNKIASSLIPYICLMLAIPPFVQFFDSYLGINCNHLKKYIQWASMLEFIVLTILHFAKIAEYRQTLFIIQITWTVAILYLISGMIGQLVMRKINRRFKICTVGLSMFFVAAIVDTVQYYESVGDADKIGRYVFLIFVFLLAWDMIKDANEIIEKGRRAKQLEVFALTDSMTGLLNRNAFESHAKSGDTLEGVVAVVADANGLKKCNDTYGHEAGDEYITIVADIFNSVYGKYGNCYRTGGDEFCCIIHADNQINTERLKKLFLTKVFTANLEGGHKYKIGVAIGDAIYDAKLDVDFRALVKRADASMYENKRAGKTS